MIPSHSFIRFLEPGAVLIRGRGQVDHDLSKLNYYLGLNAKRPKSMKWSSPSLSRPSPNRGGREGAGKQTGMRRALFGGFDAEGLEASVGRTMRAAIAKGAVMCATQIQWGRGCCLG